MAVHLSDNDIETIVKIIDGWSRSEKLTWDNLILAAQMRLLRKYSRQALSRHDRIKKAYSLKKQFLSTGSDSKSEFKSVELQKAMERIDRLKAENERLKDENNSLLEQFARWAYNAHTRGLDEAFLNRALMPINRKKTKI
ncbi:hypothetical protein SAMN02746065_1616 [Desulfocicer vacuolatum DSM 3385]|uniref:Transposase n=1 Tax=Desulfocicer vacuolatum DSM 3385 TaxID=1121400 RepID=A0A1W2EZ24_9BACT|nr:hypothetical protein [Desulfocicer vacuolatum]SMD14967.1 hypothetical protein SAMN02746065_1616 [Desulfocicer vacuolatum DSM 3385]